MKGIIQFPSYHAAAAVLRLAAALDRNSRLQYRDHA
jgi:hypothetical protein